MLKSYSG